MGGGSAPAHRPVHSPTHCRGHFCGHVRTHIAVHHDMHSAENFGTHLCKKIEVGDGGGRAHLVCEFDITEQHIWRQHGIGWGMK